MSRISIGKLLVETLFEQFYAIRPVLKKLLIVLGLYKF